MSRTVSKILIFSLIGLALLGGVGTLFAQQEPFDQIPDSNSSVNNKENSAVEPVPDSADDSVVESEQVNKKKSADEKLSETLLEKEREEQEQQERIFQVLQWGLDIQIKAVLKEITDEKNKEFSDAVFAFYERKPGEDLLAMVYLYFKETEEYRLIGEALELLRYYDEEPETLITIVIDYVIQGVEADPGHEPEDLGEILWNLYQYSGDFIGQKAIESLAIIEAKSYLESLQLEYDEGTASESIKPVLIRAAGRIGGNDISDWILELLKTELPKSERWACCEVLASLGNESHFDKILDEYREGDPYLRMKIIEAIDRFPQDRMITLLDLGLRDSFWRVRKEAIIQAGERGYEKYVPQLIFKVKTEPENVVKQEVLTALGKLQTDESLAFLKKSAADKKMSLSVKKGVFKALFQFSADKYRDFVLEIIEKEIKDPKSKILTSLAGYAAKSEQPGLEMIYSALLKSDQPPIQFAAVSGMKLNKILADEARLKELFEKNEKNYLGKAIAELLKKESD